MNKMSGRQSDFAFLREDASRLVIGYGLKEISEDLCEWNEVYLYKKQKSSISLQEVKDAIYGNIDAQTDAKILNGYPFTPDGEDEPITVWLSKENQTNFSEAHRLQIVPVKFKLNETEDKRPIYHTFVTFEELDRFYKGGVKYINQCLNEGWQEKDGIDWAPYEALFPSQSQNDNQQAE